MPSGSSGVFRSRQGSGVVRGRQGSSGVVRGRQGSSGVVRGRRGRQGSSGVVGFESSESSGVVTQNSTTIETITDITRFNTLLTMLLARRQTSL